ncbi:hypothetical protein ABZP36_009526 [Zizania latifolia]
MDMVPPRHRRALSTTVAAAATLIGKWNPDDDSDYSLFFHASDPEPEPTTSRAPPPTSTAPCSYSPLTPPMATTATSSSRPRSSSTQPSRGCSSPARALTPLSTRPGP